MKVLRGPESAPLAALRDRIVAVLGFGNQGHAHALNLRDSGIRVVVGCRAGSAGGAAAGRHGLDVLSIPSAVAAADLVIMAIADHAQADVYRDEVSPHLRPGTTLGFLHGLSIRFKLIEPSPGIGVVMIAPKGPGVLLRDRYTQGHGLPCLLAVHQESARRDAESVALAWAGGIGSSRAAIVYTTFADETETDLFGEQAVLCGGLSALIVAAFETLVEAGYPPELAYLECCQEVKQIADLVYERGLAGMRRAISGTAEFGAYVAGPRVVNASVRQTLRQLLGEIQKGHFVESLRRDAATGGPWQRAQRQAADSHSIEAAGRAVRSLMPQPPKT